MFSPGILQTLYFAQGHTPQSLKLSLTSGVQDDADELSRILEEASDVAHVKQPSGGSESQAVKLKTVEVDTMRKAMERVTLLPADLLPADLQPSDVLSVSKALNEAPSENDTIVVNFVILQMVNRILEKAAKSPGLLRDIPNLPPLSTELGPPRHFDYGATIKRVRIGVMIELSTIPLYLYAMYSVKPQNEGLRVRAILRGVLQQEMLHLALSGNLLSALGGSVALYDPRIIPIYPAPLLCSKIPMHLEALDTASIGRFMEIEAPVDASHPSSRSDDRNVLASQYDSIGQLYEDLVLSVRGLESEKFTNNLDKQFVGQDFFGGQLFAITDQATALRALGTIIEQGEGNLSVTDSHYEVLSDLYSGPAWDVYSVPTNPRTEDYKDDLYVWRLSLSFDAAYCYLLQTIQRVWNTENVSARLVLMRNIHGLMTNVLTPLAEVLVQQTFKDGCAAPCFDYYPMHDSVAKSPLGPRELHRALANEIDWAIQYAADDDTIGRDAKQAVQDVVSAVNKAFQKAKIVAPHSPDAQKAEEIAGAVAVRVNSDTNATVELATQIAKDAAQVAVHTQAAARIGAKTNLRAAGEAADAATEVNGAGETVVQVALRASAKPFLMHLKSYVEDHLYPPF